MTPPSLYERIMGDSFARLAPAVQAFHRLAGRHHLEGLVQTQAPVNLAARLLARCLGAPGTSGSGPIRFELDAGPEAETWTRHFPAKTMTSRLERVDARMVENLGLARLTFELQEAQGRLVMRLRHLRFLGIPCPRWLMPRIVAMESGDADRLHFDVQASVPGIGLVTRYSGHLAVPSRARP
ncbi:MAG TPA: DUF4166 domain-containing protein [Ramlibacter sp.]|nr:DUF4166 domain-containing protein [Ramlibacter sp.]